MSKIICDLVPDKNNSRSSEETFITLKNNNILLYIPAIEITAGRITALRIYMALYQTIRGEPSASLFPFCYATVSAQTI